ncbi:MAG: hypothetical protein Ct9H300mP28_33470 [Pseudomonadota bacterium]|nr:MAG: hypothetical protein Ct9H300mP28_33470 [Pseudomonadota bacterium]
MILGKKIMGTDVCRNACRNRIWEKLAAPFPHGMSYAVAGLVKDYQPQGWPADHPMVPHGISVIVKISSCLS